MQREILFRGKRTDNGEWIAGNYVCAEALNGEFFEHFIIEVFNDGKTHSIDPSTIGQYTGLTDKNGKKIFEGDVFSRDSDKTYNNSNHVVYWNNYYGEWTQSCKDRYTNGSSLWISVKTCEVIGNIHDNPEPLEATP